MYSPTTGRYSKWRFPNVTHVPDTLKTSIRWFPCTIVSGGQTGADRAALDWAIGRGIVHGGWCPKGRLATDGPLAPIYQLTETESAGYRQRTKLNVQGSDATLIFNLGELDGGTRQTVRFAQTLKKPHCFFQIDQMTRDDIAREVGAWSEQGQYAVLNIAGPSEEKRPSIYARVMDILDLCMEISTPSCE